MILEIISYIFFGVLTTLVNLIVYKFCLLFGIHYVIASVIAWIVAVLFAFFTNSKWVFKMDNSKSISKQMFEFVSGRVFTGILETFGLIILVDGFNNDEMIAKYIMMVFVVLSNYFISKFLVFKTLEK